MLRYAAPLLAALLARVLVNVHRELRLFESMLGRERAWPETECRCVRLLEGHFGLEDVAAYNASVVFAGSFDLPHVYYHPDVASDPGAKAANKAPIWALIRGRYPRDPPKQVAIKGANTAIIPHGIAVRDDRLFVVNHAYSRGGERVDRFKIDPQTLDLALESSVVFAPPSFGERARVGFGALNSVAPVGNDGAFFATVWAPPLLFHSPSRRPNTTAFALKEAAYVLSGSPATFFVYCPVSAKKGTDCAVVGEPCRLCNGIAVSNDDERVFVADSLRHTVTAYDITGIAGDEEATPALIRAWRTALPSPFYPDNLRVDAAGDLLIAATGPVVRFLTHKRELEAWGAAGGAGPPPLPTGFQSAAFVIPAHVARADDQSPPHTLFNLEPAFVIPSHERFGGVSGVERTQGFWTFASFSDSGVLRCKAGIE